MPYEIVRYECCGQQVLHTEECLRRRREGQLMSEGEVIKTYTANEIWASVEMGSQFDTLKKEQFVKLADYEALRKEKEND